jgi:hypothetical protein
MNNNPIGLVVFSVALMVAGGCTPVKKNPADNSKPTVEIKVQESGGGEYAVMSDTTLSISDSLHLMCNVTDPQGVKSGFLSFKGSSDSCTVDELYSGGTFSIQTMPTNIPVSLQGDAQGNVLTTLPILSDLNGPFTCKVGKPPCTADAQACMHGAPYDGVITVTCTGENWSANAQNQSATKTLTIKLH